MVCRFDNPLALLIPGVIQNPVAIAFALFGVKSSISKLDSFETINWVQGILTQAIVIIITYYIAQLFTQFVITHFPAL
ncbi:hypothetical protein Riv7116_4525 [Rivularia sp. PCC 7116]|uniref:hypothetical protein n=1 Tax=Rivularia sp. PCC 7116 TaxID=373994 RepID=UPI00029F1B5A|nr:hypothetical protein [Rivularia sp. PCC 7116]AFY56946.1 hypothetical protein Riv7116_4525 [Rivularia sp. PCC 7116]